MSEKIGSSFLLYILCVPILLIALMVKLSSKGPVLYWSDRVGSNNSIFKMPKFRTMYIDTLEVATHLMENPESYLTLIGVFLRKFSFVGPHPALYNQDDLIKLRTEKGIYKIIPGITGWAQVNGRDEISIPKKVDFDKYYLRNRSFF